MRCGAKAVLYVTDSWDIQVLHMLRSASCEAPSGIPASVQELVSRLIELAAALERTAGAAGGCVLRLQCEPRALEEELGVSGLSFGSCI